MKGMLRAILAAVMLVVFSFSAMAQETSWTGPYVGLDAGYGNGNIETVLSSYLTVVKDSQNTIKMDVNGALFGVQLGYNHLFNGVILGLETDLQIGNIKGGLGSTSVTDTLAFGTETELNWVGTTRIRLGYPIGRFLPYITGGVAYGQSVTTTTIASLLNNEETYGAVGYALGAGIECMIFRNFSVRGEYTHVDLGMSKIKVVLSGEKASIERGLGNDVFKVGINYHF